MKVQFARACVGLAALAVAAPAVAADWAVSGGSVREVHGGAAAVPVPAPRPVPDYKPTLYFRFDAGIGMVSEPSISESGFEYGAGTAPGDNKTALGSIPSWFSGDFDTFLTLGGGAGYYLGNGFRVDATIEKRSKDDAHMDGENHWLGHVGVDHDLNPATDPLWVVEDANTDGVADLRYRVQVSDTSKIDGTVWMLNGYYDFASHGRGFTPYIGAGLGFVWNEVSRTHSSTVARCDNDAGAGLGCDVNNYTNATTSTASDDAEKVTMAAALMAGFSYDVTYMTAIDVGYRYLYLQGTDVSMNINGTPSTLEIGDQHIHQLRAGLRFNVN